MEKFLKLLDLDSEEKSKSESQEGNLKSKNAKKQKD